MKQRVAPMRAHSFRESLAKTVRMLTKSGIAVSFQGHIPHVRAVGNKAVRLVLPEINDDAKPELIEALQGFLDHEIGHIFYTPWARACQFQGKDNKRDQLHNIVEDIRLEKLLPRDLPGTKENIERMHEKAIPFYFAPGVLQGIQHPSPSIRFTSVLVTGLRALGGQRAFQKFMDDNGLWVHMKPLLVALPDLSRQLRTMETYDDVENIVEAIVAATTPPPAIKEPEPDPEDDEPTEQQPAPQMPPPPTNCPDPSDGDGDDDSDQSNKDGLDPDSDASDEDGDTDGAGGAADEDDDEASDSGDDGDGGDDADARGDTDDGDSDSAGGEDDDAADDDGPGGDQEPGGSDHDAPVDKLNPGDGGKNSTTLTDALKQLEPNQRAAIHRYKKRKQTVAEIASDMEISEDEVLELLRTARKRLNEILKGS